MRWGLLFTFRFQFTNSQPFFSALHKHRRESGKINKFTADNGEKKLSADQLMARETVQMKLIFELLKTQLVCVANNNEILCLRRLMNDRSLFCVDEKNVNS